MADAQFLSDVSVASLITRFENNPERPAEQLPRFLVKLLMAGARHQGFWSGEIIPPSAAGASDWRLVQRFKTVSEARDWQNSARRQALLKELSAAEYSEQPSVSATIAEHDESGVATAIVTDVRAGMENEFFAWQEKIQIAQSKRAGYRGVYIQPPPPDRQRQWATLLRFDSPQSLNEWFACDERKELLREAERFVAGTQFRHITTSFPGWVPVSSSTGESPPNWKTAMLVLLGLFPIVMLELRFLSGPLVGVNPSASSFLKMVFSVIGTTYVTMPLCIKYFGWWLFPKPNEANAHLKGLLMVLALYACEIALLWNLVST